MSKAVGRGSPRNAQFPLRALVVHGNRRSNFLRPLVATPRLPIWCSEEPVSRALTMRLGLEERDTFFVQYHIPGSEFRRATLSMRQLQVGPIEIGRSCFRQFFRTSSGNFKATQKGCCCRGGQAIRPFRCAGERNTAVSDSSSSGSVSRRRAAGLPI